MNHHRKAEGNAAPVETVSSEQRRHRADRFGAVGEVPGKAVGRGGCGTRMFLLWMGIILSAAGLFAGCRPSTSGRIQGYLEGEYVYVASALAGTLEKLAVQRGMLIKEGAPLFALDDIPEKAARDEAERRLNQARASLEDARKGRRPTEIESLEASRRQAEAALQLSESEWAREEKLSQKPGATTQQAVDRARSMRDQDRQRLAQLNADLATARLGARTDQIKALEDNVRALESALARAEWDLSQKSQSAPQSGLVFDTLYREGEWVAAGRPVVVVLPPENIKLRMFVPETLLGQLQPGDAVQVFMDGVSGSAEGKISFISPQAEYTPPMVYSRENRRKFLYLVEAIFAPEVAARLHPGQPVEVQVASNRP